MGLFMLRRSVRLCECACRTLAYDGLCIFGSGYFRSAVSLNLSLWCVTASSEKTLEISRDTVLVMVWSPACDLDVAPRFRPSKSKWLLPSSVVWLPCTRILCSWVLSYKFELSCGTSGSPLALFELFDGPRSCLPFKSCPVCSWLDSSITLRGEALFEANLEVRAGDAWKLRLLLLLFAELRSFGVLP
jgi:hypothetical protein